MQRGHAHRLAPAAAVFEDAATLFDSGSIDGVIICSPTALHAEHARSAIERGLHVYLEKPLATSLSDGALLRDAWSRAGLVGMLGFNYRYNELFRRLRADIRSGTIGPIVAVRTAFSGGLGELPIWKQRRHTGGGVLLDLGSHHIDLLRFLLEREIRSVRATIWSRRSEEDCAHLELEFEGGSRVQSLLTFGAAASDRIEIHGEQGRLAVNRYASWDVDYEPQHLGLQAHLRGMIGRFSLLRRVRYGAEKLQSPLHEPSYRQVLERFVAAIHGAARGEPNFDDGLTCLAVVAAAERSAHSGGQAVEMSDVLAEPQIPYRVAHVS